MRLTTDERHASTPIRYVPFLLVTMATLVLVASASPGIWQSHYTGVRWSGGVVTAVDPDGPAGAAGLRGGDRLLSVDGAPPPAHSASFGGPGDRVRLSVLRGDRPLTVEMQLVPVSPRDRVMLVEALLLAGLVWAASLAIWFLDPSRPETRVYFLGSQVLAGMLALGNPWVVQWHGSLEVFCLLLLLLAPLTLHLNVLFPEPITAERRRPLLLVWYMAALLVAASLVGLPRLGFRVAEPEALFTVLRLYTATTLLLALALFFRPTRSPSLEVRRRRRLLVAGITAGVTPILVLSFLPDTLSAQPLVDYPWTLPFLLLGQVAYARAIRREGLSRADLVLNRSLVYALLGVLLAGTYAALLFGFSHLIPGAHPSTLLTGALAALLIAGMMGPLRSMLQRRVDRLFYGGWYDYQTLVRTASAELSRAHDTDHLVYKLSEIARSMRFGAAALFWARGAGLAHVGGYGYCLYGEIPPTLHADGPLVRCLERAARPRRRDQLLSALAEQASTDGRSGPETAMAGEDRFAVWLPLVSRGGLQGVLVLGERQEDLLDAGDMDILATVGAQAAVAAENIALLDALRARVAELERLRDELAEVRTRVAQSREAERLRLAQELHDGPVQDLYGVRFRLGGLCEDADDAVPVAEIASVQACLDEVSTELRSLCSELRPPALAPFGLGAAIRSHATGFARAHPGLEVELDVMADGKALPEPTRLALFRVYQEALNNTVRHANSRSVGIRFEIDAERVLLEVRDDGRGFIVPSCFLALAREGHLGLLGASERVEAIGGRLEVAAAPGKGTRTRVIVPGGSAAAPVAAGEGNTAHGRDWGEGNPTGRSANGDHQSGIGRRSSGPAVGRA